MSNIPWIQVIDTELMNCCLGTADESDSLEEATEKLANLIDFNVDLSEYFKKNKKGIKPYKHTWYVDLGILGNEVLVYFNFDMTPFVPATREDPPEYGELLNLEIYCQEFPELEDKIGTFLSQDDSFLDYCTNLIEHKTD